MILFQLLFEVADDQRAVFEQTYKQVFEPALRKQTGFQSAKPDITIRIPTSITPR